MARTQQDWQELFGLFVLAVFFYQGMPFPTPSHLTTYTLADRVNSTHATAYSQLTPYPTAAYFQRTIITTVASVWECSVDQGED